MTSPHPNNACAGNYSDWLEVNLLPECNGSCSWCVEARAYHPTRRAHWTSLAYAAIQTGRQNIILLGGEPTLHPNLADIIDMLVDRERQVYLTTNGSRLTKTFVNYALKNLTGINISVHHFALSANEKITGAPLDMAVLRDAISALRKASVEVRLNCNLIGGHIDSHEEIKHFVYFAKGLGATSVRFAELKHDDESFVSIHDITDGEYDGTNNEPWGLGCSTDATIDGMPVNFRQMCGLQTQLRPRPENPVQPDKAVLYYDSQVYPGWQSAGELCSRAVRDLLADVAGGHRTPAEADYLITGG